MHPVAWMHHKAPEKGLQHKAFLCYTVTSPCEGVDHEEVLHYGKVYLLQAHPRSFRL